MKPTSTKAVKNLKNNNNTELIEHRVLDRKGHVKVYMIPKQTSTTKVTKSI